MPCLKGPHVPIPTLPFPLSIPGLTLPGVSFDAELCCKIAIAIPPLPIPIPPGVLNPAIIATLLGYIEAINAFIDSLPLNCPLD